MKAPLDAALFYALERGWPVLPVRPRGKAPLTQHGVKDATTEESVIQKMVGDLARCKRDDSDRRAVRVARGRHRSSA